MNEYTIESTIDEEIRNLSKEELQEMLAVRLAIWVVSPYISDESLRKACELIDYELKLDK